MQQWDQSVIVNRSKQNKHAAAINTTFNEHRLSHLTAKLIPTRRNKIEETNKKLELPHWV